jgi:hypothetical protein
MGNDLVNATGACKPKEATLSVYTDLIVGNGPETPLENISLKVNGKPQSSGVLGVATFMGLEVGKKAEFEADLGLQAAQYGWERSDSAVLKGNLVLKEGLTEIGLIAMPLPSMKVTVFQVSKDRKSKKPEPKIEVVASRQGGGETTVVSAEDTGVAEFKALRPGVYRLDVKLKGAQDDSFVSTGPIENVALNLNKAVTASLHLLLKGTLRVEVARYDKKALSKAAKVTVKHKASGKTFPVKDSVPGTDPNTSDPLGVAEFKLAPDIYTVSVQTQEKEGDWKIDPKKGQDVEEEVHDGELTPLRFALTPYKKVQFIGFEVRPDVASSKIYLGDKDATTDIEERCAIMKRAIVAATNLADPPESTLKVFMAPEFFFRGAEGGYPVEKISSIVDETLDASVAKETIKADYKDWLFVLGTAIGYLPHEQTKDDGSPQWWGSKATHSVGPAKVHRLRILGKVRIGTEMKVRTDPVDGFAGRGSAKWHLRQTAPMPASQPVIGTETDSNGQFWLRLQGPDDFQDGADVDLEISNLGIIVREVTTINFGGKDVTRLKIQAPICKQLLSGTQKVRWKVRQKHSPFDLENAVTGFLLDSSSPLPDDYFLALDKVADYKVDKPIELIEPIAAEVFNVALVRRGGPDPKPPPPGLRRAIVFKEYVSSIDFLGKNRGGNDFGTEDGHKILIYGKTRTVLPTAGSRAMLGSSPEEVNPSEINKSGEGGGSVFTMDGITFGLEVCLDHLMARLHQFYQGGHAQPGDPKPQVYLIPSWGMSIGGGPTSAVPETPIFNVDGSRVEAVATLHKDQKTCEEHGVKKAKPYPHECPKSDPSNPCYLIGPAIPASNGGTRRTVVSPGYEKYFSRDLKLVAFDPVPIPDAQKV